MLDDQSEAAEADSALKNKHGNVDRKWLGTGSKNSWDYPFKFNKELVRLSL